MSELHIVVATVAVLIMSVTSVVNERNQHYDIVKNTFRISDQEFVSEELVKHDVTLSECEKELQNHVAVSTDKETYTVYGCQVSAPSRGDTITKSS